MAIINVLTGLGSNNLVADGSTDNATHFTAAIAANPGATFYFPGGQYNFNSLVSITDGIYCYGDPNFASIIYGVNSISTAPWGTIGSNITFKDLFFTGAAYPSSSQTAQCLLLSPASVTGKSKISISHCKFSNGNSAGIRVPNATDQVLITDCEFTQFGTQFSASGISGTLTNSVVNRCYFHDCGVVASGPPIQTQHCIYINGPAYNVTVSNCLVENPNNAPFTAGNSGSGTFMQNIAYLNNTISGTAIDSCIGCGEVTGCLIQGNNINISSSNAPCGIYIGADNSDTLVNGNTIQFANSTAAFGNMGIRFVFTNARCVASNNVICTPYQTNMAGTGIQVYNCLDATITDNTITGLNRAIGVNANGIGGDEQPTRLRILRNQLIQDDNATQSGGAFADPVNGAVNLAGYVNDCEIGWNVCRGFTDAFSFTQLTSPYAGLQSYINIHDNRVYNNTNLLNFYAAGTTGNTINPNVNFLVAAYNVADSINIVNSTAPYVVNTRYINNFTTVQFWANTAPVNPNPGYPHP